MSPAAATSQSERPPSCTYASKRPLATYASASAAEPMSREMRIALRTLRARVGAVARWKGVEAFHLRVEVMLGKKARRRGGAQEPE